MASFIIPMIGSPPLSSSEGSAPSFNIETWSCNLVEYGLRTGPRKRVPSASAKLVRKTTSRHLWSNSAREEQACTPARACACRLADARLEPLALQHRRLDRDSCRLAQGELVVQSYAETAGISTDSILHPAIAAVNCFHMATLGTHAIQIASIDGRSARPRPQRHLTVLR